MPWYAYLLAPAAFLFHGITAARNFLFDRGLIRSLKSPIPTLVVGNLSVGGTGKTPWVEFLVRKLRDEVAVGTLSRGYGRSSKGFIQVLPKSTTADVGGEPLQLYAQFKEEYQFKKRFIYSAFLKYSLKSFCISHSRRLLLRDFISSSSVS